MKGLHTRLFYCSILILFAGHPALGAGALTIEITEGMEGALPIAVVPFGWQGKQPPAAENLSAVVAADLAHSGRFAPLPDRDLIDRPHQGSEIRFKNWRILGIENLVVGDVREQSPGRYTARFQLFDIFRQEQLAGYSIDFSGSEFRSTAHYISDIIYEKLTGQRGAFSTRIAYVTAIRSAGSTRFFLKIADADGYNEQTILDSPMPVMSPAWSPDGTRLAYVSFEEGRSRIFVQEVTTGKREFITSFKGINGAPVWSPDGKRLAMALSKDGNPEIYLMDFDSRNFTRLTRSAAIDTEPAWSPDGRDLVFTSDRGGKPQIYRINATAGGTPQRLTFEGEYNARAMYSPDGEQLAMVHGNRGQYRIAVLELKSGNLRILTDSILDESPSFAPNGSMIIYATSQNGRGVLAAVSVDGRVHQRLALREGDIREPAWSPYNE